MNEPLAASVGGEGRASNAADDGLVARVRKLMDKAAATTNTHEADAFSRKAAELVARHRIDPLALADRADDVLAVREIPLGRGAYVRARLALLTAVASAHDSRVVFGATPRGTIAYVAGYMSDLDVVEVMYTSLHAQAAARMAAERRSTSAATQAFRRSFLFGYADRVGTSLADARRIAETESKIENATDAAATGLARIERERRVDLFVEQEFGRVRAAGKVAGAEVGGWSAGRSAADAADMGRARLAGRRALGAG